MSATDHRVEGTPRAAAALAKPWRVIREDCVELCSTDSPRSCEPMAGYSVDAMVFRQSTTTACGKCAALPGDTAEGVKTT